MKHKLSLKKETRHTAVYETEDPLAPVVTVYVQKSWLAAQVREPSDPLIPQALEIEVTRGKG